MVVDLPRYPDLMFSVFFDDGPAKIYVRLDVPESMTVSPEPEITGIPVGECATWRIQPHGPDTSIRVELAVADPGPAPAPGKPARALRVRLDVQPLDA